MPSSEGYSAAEVSYPIRVLGRAGIRSLVLTNAAGGINTEYSQGALVVLRDHINLQATNPLIGANDERFGPRFPDMTTAYWRAYREITVREAMRLGMELHEGVYAAVTGPSFETPAEIRYLRTICADLVGMSTVLETIVARHMGIRVLGISCVTNMAAGILDQPLSHGGLPRAPAQPGGEGAERAIAGIAVREQLPRLADLLGVATHERDKLGHCVVPASGVLEQIPVEPAGDQYPAV